MEHVREPQDVVIRPAWHTAERAGVPDFRPTTN
jgi:hypothetical protein